MARKSKAFPAKYRGKCPLCNQYWQPGVDMLNYVDNVLQHVECPAAQAAPTASQQSIRRMQQSGTNVPLDITQHPASEALISDNSIDELAALFNDVSDEPQPSSFIPSIYQTRFFEALEDVVSKVSTHRHIVVEAVAGSGKTTTLIEGIKRLFQRFSNLDVCIVAFNKHIATEFQNKLTKLLGGNHGVLAVTKHSLGLAAIRKTYPKAKVDKYNDKLFEIMDEFWPVSKQAINEGKITEGERRINYIKRNAMRNLTAICKNVLTDYNDANDVLSTIDKYDIQIDDDMQDEVIERLPYVMDKCKENPELVSFDDMGWLPIVLNLSVDKFDVLMIDEFQDMSKGDMEFLFRCIKDDGHIIGVGDRYQSLYAFRGADSQAIPRAIKMLDALVLPLSVTYRCPRSHVELAKNIVSEIEPRDDAPMGAVERIDYMNLAITVQPGDMVICRTNAPLIRPAFECIRMGKKAMIRGADIGDALVNLIKRFDTNDLSAFAINLAEYFEKEFEKLVNKGKELQAMMLKDKVDTLVYIMNECDTVSALKDKIDMLFSDNNAGVIFSSVHRAKGLEAQRVFIMREDLMPHPKAKEPEQYQQEQNALYVALTRSKQDLIFVNGGEKL